MEKGNERKALGENQDQKEGGDPHLQNHEVQPAVKILRVVTGRRKRRVRSRRNIKRGKVVFLHK
eukprot:2487945-Karenia_brevis.AAC.1